MYDKKNIEVVPGDGSNLEISPVYDHLNGSTPKSSDEKPKNIVIPEEKPRPENNKEDDNEKDEENDVTTDDNKNEKNEDNTDNTDN